MGRASPSSCTCLQPRSRSVAMASFPLVSATGMLGSGFRAESLDKAISLGARMIGCDAGSTDPGPGPLATGTCMFSAAAVKRDTEIMMTRAIKAGIPLIIGSAGTSGSDTGLAWMVDIVREIAREQDLHFNFASFIRNYRETSSVGIFATGARENSLRSRAGSPHIVTPIIVFRADCSRYGENPTRSWGREKFSAPF